MAQSSVDVHEFLLLPNEAWRRRAACAVPGVTTATFFATSTDRARLVCSACRVRAECLAYAVEHDLAGVWGGLTERERRRLTPARPSRTVTA